jgi:hypothetical protein
VIALDTNVLVYAHRRESRQHVAARALIHDLAEGSNPWAIPWPCIYEFFSVVTNARIWRDAATSAADAWRQIDAWVEAPTNRLLGEADDFLVTLRRLTNRPRVRGPVIHDARIAAICIAHAVSELLSADRDFALFTELKVRDPF